MAWQHGVCRGLLCLRHLRICKKFLTTTWSSSGRILTPEALEEATGERLRLQECSDKFLSDELAGVFVVALAESQPALQVPVLILRRWFAEYHPDCGSLLHAIAEELEEALGDELWCVYQGLGYKALPARLGSGRKAVLISAFCLNF